MRPAASTRPRRHTTGRSIPCRPTRRSAAGHPRRRPPRQRHSRSPGQSRVRASSAASTAARSRLAAPSTATAGSPRAGMPSTPGRRSPRATPMPPPPRTIRRVASGGGRTVGGVVRGGRTLSARALRRGAGVRFGCAVACTVRLELRADLPQLTVLKLGSRVLARGRARLARAGEWPCASARDDCRTGGRCGGCAAGAGALPSDLRGAGRQERADPAGVPGCALGAADHVVAADAVAALDLPLEERDVEPQLPSSSVEPHSTWPDAAERVVVVLADPQLEPGAALLAVAVVGGRQPRIVDATAPSPSSSAAQSASSAWLAEPAGRTAEPISAGAVLEPRAHRPRRARSCPSPGRPTRARAGRARRLAPRRRPSRGRGTAARSPPSRRRSRRLVAALGRRRAPRNRGRSPAVARRASLPALERLERPHASARSATARPRPRPRAAARLGERRRPARGPRTARRARCRRPSRRQPDAREPVEPRVAVRARERRPRP